ncbi:hypothetical protein IM25_23760 (plasmid) [Rhodococcus sp. p52]|nr:hypothetical protein IM25_23760 [Rhodococcus sp. p52]
MPPCNRAHTDTASADHLFINVGIRNMLEREGRRPVRVRFDGDFRTGGTCKGVTVELPNGQGSIVVALRGADLSDWKKREARLLASSQWVSWLFGPGQTAPRSLLRRNGYSLHLALQDAADGRLLRLGTQLPNGRTHWTDFGDLQLSAGGLVTTASQKQKSPVADRRSSTSDIVQPVPKAPKLKPPRTVILHNDIRITVPEFQALLASIEQRYESTGKSAKARLVAEYARTLRPRGNFVRLDVPFWMRRDIDSALGL